MPNVIVTELGQNSCMLSCSAPATRPEILDAIEEVAVAHGWEVYHKISSTRTIFSAPNVDGTSYKYVEINMLTSYIQLTAYESWNIATSAGTNPTYQTSTDGNQRLNVGQAYTLFLFITPRYFIMYCRMVDGTYGSGTGKTWTGCIEVSRDNEDEVPGNFPIFVSTNGYGMVGLEASGTQLHCASFPRTPDNYTAARGSQQTYVSCVAGGTGNSTAGGRLCDSIPAKVNPFSGLPNIYTPYVGCQGINPHVRGRMYGIKLMTRNAGAPLDTVSIKCDSDGFYSPNGVETDHYILAEENSGVRFAIPA